MLIRRIAAIALFMLIAFLGLKVMGAPEWAMVLGSVAAGEFLWLNERKRAAGQHLNTRLQQIITDKTQTLETKLNDVMVKLQKLSGELAEANEHASQTEHA